MIYENKDINDVDLDEENQLYYYHNIGYKEDVDGKKYVKFVSFKRNV